MDETPGNIILHVKMASIWAWKEITISMEELFCSFVRDTHSNFRL